LSAFFSKKAICDSESHFFPNFSGYIRGPREEIKYLLGATIFEYDEAMCTEVKEGLHVLTKEKVVVKQVKKKMALRHLYLARNLYREQKLLQMVHHPNISQLLEVIENENSYCLIHEDGHVMPSKKLDERETRKYMRQIVSAVEHIHRAGIIHRDLKLQDCLLLDPEGNIQIFNFGLANQKYIMENQQRVRCRTPCGSAVYAAPEMLGVKPYGPEVDIWSM
jgi:Neu-associated kinase